MGREILRVLACLGLMFMGVVFIHSGASWALFPITVTKDFTMIPLLPAHMAACSVTRTKSEHQNRTESQEQSLRGTSRTNEARTPRDFSRAPSQVQGGHGDPRHDQTGALGETKQSEDPARPAKTLEKRRTGL